MFRAIRANFSRYATEMDYKFRISLTIFQLSTEKIICNYMKLQYVLAILGRQVPPVKYLDSRKLIL